MKPKIPTTLPPQIIYASKTADSAVTSPFPHFTASAHNKASDVRVLTVRYVGVFRLLGKKPGTCNLAVETGNEARHEALQSHTYNIHCRAEL